jgi:hypothetical protein
MSNAEAKALGLLAGNATGIDGYVGFNNSANYTFNPNNRAVAGEYDFIGLALHEITEVMGRYGVTQNGCGASLCDSTDRSFPLYGKRRLQPQPDERIVFFDRFRRNESQYVQRYIWWGSQRLGRAHS